MRPATYKVGELARLTGLSVRTLHHYDEIGLLSPSLRTDAGHRLYTQRNIARLQRIRSLKQLGFSLGEIRGCLDLPGYSHREVIEGHIKRLKEHIEAQRALCERLEATLQKLDAEKVSAHDFILTIERITMSERLKSYYTPEQLEKLERRGRALGEAHIREVEAEWPQLIAQVQAEMDAGTDPKDARVQALARRWMELVNEFTGGDPAIRASLNNLWKQEKTVHGMDTAHMRELGTYLSKALEDPRTSA